MHQDFHRNGLPSFTKSSHIDQHWIGVNLFNPILISKWRNLKRNINFTCLHTYWMWCVLAESILLLDGNGSPASHQFMFTTRFYGRISIRRIMSWYTMDYLPQYTKSCLVKKNHVFLLKDKGLLKNMETSTWHQMESTSKLKVAPSSTLVTSFCTRHFVTSGVFLSNTCEWCGHFSS